MFGFHIVKTKALDELREELTLAQRTLEDIGWINMSELDDIQTKLVAGGFKKAVQRSKIYYYNNPLAGHWVNLTTAFVFGEGISVPKSEDDEIQEIIESFWNNADNKKAFTDFSAYTALNNKMMYEGNLFIAMFDDELGDVRIRIFNAEEIDDIIMDPDDRMRPLFYKVKIAERKYNFNNDSFEMSTAKFFYIPDIENASPERFGVPKNKLMENVKMLHVKMNTDINDKFGVPELFRGIDWMKAHKDMAGDMATYIKSLAQFAWKKKVKGNQAKVNSIRDAMASKTNLSNLANSVGKTQIENEGIDLQAINISSSGVKNMSDGLKQMTLQVCAGSGIFHHYFGDPSTGNLATAKTMELPMLRKFVSYQKLWTKIFETVLVYQIERKMIVGLLPGGMISVNTKTNREEFETDREMEIDIDFPPILEADVKESAQAFSDAKKNKLLSKRTAAEQFMLAINMNDTREELEKMEEEGAFDEPEFGDNPFNVNPFDNGGNGRLRPPVRESGARKKGKKLKETIDAPEKKLENVSERLARKNNFTEQRMNGYRKALSFVYNSFLKEVEKGIKVSHSDQYGTTGIVEGLDEMVARFSAKMKGAARRFFPIAVDIGEKFMRAELKERNFKVREAQGSSNDILDQALEWNDSFIEESLSVHVANKIRESVRNPYSSEDEFRGAVRKAASSFEHRIEQYVGAFWTVEEMAVREAGSGYGLMVDFVGPADEHNCSGCENAVNNSPWLMEEAPIPGQQDCLGRCRHALQIRDAVN